MGVLARHCRRVVALLRRRRSRRGSVVGGTSADVFPFDGSGREKGDIGSEL